VCKTITSITRARGWNRNPFRVVLWLGSSLIALMFSVANASPAVLHGQTASVNNTAAPAPPMPRWDSTPSVLTSEYEYHEPTNQSRNQQFGVQVALSGDGRTMAVADLWYFGGSEWPWYGSGAVYVYRLTSGGWTQEAKLEPPGARGYDFFGSDVALSMSGDTLVVGAQNEGYDAPSQDAGPGSVFVYKRREGAWTQEAMLRASRPQDNVLFGRAVEVSALGNVIAVGAPYESIEMDGVMQSGAGAVYVFTKQAGVWVEQQALSAPNPQRYDLFGWGVRLSENGRTLAILAGEQNWLTEDEEVGGWPDRDNTVYVFEAQSGGWNLAAELEGSANDLHFGGAAYESEGQSEGFDVSADGRTLAVASPFARAEDGGTGLVRIYRRRGQHWMAANATLTPSLPERRSFGMRLTLSANGRTLVAFADRDDGAYGQPYVVAFDYLHHQWQQAAIFETTGPQISVGFGNSLALSWSGRRLAVGARIFPTENTWWGAVLVYGRQTSVAKP
jgi:hypothetical protein